MTLNLAPYQRGETLVNLDVTRRELTEFPLTFHRKSSEFSSASRNLIGGWPGTATYTLQVLNHQPDFSETAKYEYLKLRLTDFNCNTDFFTEGPEGTRKDQNGGNPYDYFITGKVAASNLPQGYPYAGTGDTGSNSSVPGNLLFAGVAPVTSGLLQAPVPLQSDVSLPMFSSKAIYSYNQGFFLRFWFEGEPSFKRGSVLTFFFGEYAIRLNSNGSADLQQTVDNAQTYQLLKTFQWTDAESVHGKHHNLLIFPHARNKIEIQSQDQEQVRSGLFDVGVTPFPLRGTVYEIPGEIVYQPDGVTPLITAAAPIYVSLSAEFRPHFQVSLLGFTNGMNPDGSGLAYYYDGVIDLYAFPGIPIQTSLDADLNGCRLNILVSDPTTNQAWQPNTPTNNLCQIGFGMIGLGDLGNGTVSSRTPEVYGYSIDKGPVFNVIQRSTVTLPTMSNRIDRGDRAESERLSITIDNSQYQADAFRERGNIPLTLVDGLSGLTLFEGTGMSVEAGEAVKPAQGIIIEACGMVDKLRRKHFTPLAPNFGKDPADPMGRGYFWSYAVKWCFAIGGFDPDTQVVIEDVAHYDFRLWDEAGGGGTRGGTGSQAGDGHVRDVGQGPRWKPAPDTTPDDYLTMLVCDFLGWHYYWNTLDHKWHVYKRPLPTNARDQANLVPKCSFWDRIENAQAYDTTGLPIYLHSRARSRTTRPQYTTVIGEAMLIEAHILSRAELQAALKAEQNGDSNPSDPLIKTAPRMVGCTYINKFGYAGPTNQPPNTAHPDYLGEPCTRWLYFKDVTSRDALEWRTRMASYDLLHGYVYKEFEADWGDALTVGLRKWDQVYYNGRLAYIDHIEADYGRDGNRRAQYSVTIARPDAPPPR